MVLKLEAESGRNGTEPATATGCKMPSGDRWIDRQITVKAPAYDESSEPSFLNAAPVGCNRAQCLMDLGNGCDSLPSTDQDTPQDKKALEQEDPGTLETGGVSAVDDSRLTELSSTVSFMSPTLPLLQDLCYLSTSC